MDPADEAEMTARFKAQIQREYRELLDDCAHAIGELKDRLPGPFSQKENERVKQMIKRYQKAKARDYFQSGEERELEAGIHEILDTMRDLASDVGKPFRGLGL